MPHKRKIIGKVIKNSNDNTLRGPWGESNRVRISWISNSGRREIRRSLEIIHLQYFPTRISLTYYYRNCMMNHRNTLHFRARGSSQDLGDNGRPRIADSATTYPAGCTTRMAIPPYMRHMLDICWIPNFHISFLYRCKKLNRPGKDCRHINLESRYFI